MPDDAPLIRAVQALADPTPDAELLRRFAATRDDSAFELLVRRHADLVWKVCRGVLATDRHAAEDAFQATFLALSRKAGGVRGNLPGWLYAVARRAALRAGRAGGVRPLFDLPESATGDANRGRTPPARPDPDMYAALHDEIGRLSARYREPLLLCFFEGHTHADAARRLGWPVGTVASRIGRAKELLRGRLARRGVALSAVLLAGPADAVSPGLVRACVSCVIGPPAGVPAAVVSLTEGVLFAMRVAKLKVAAVAAAVLVGVAGVGVTVGVGQDKKGPPAAGGEAKAAGKPAVGWNTDGEVPSAFPDIKPGGEPIPLPAGAKRIEIPDTDPPMVKLRKAKLNAALRLVELKRQGFESGQVSFFEMNEAWTAAAAAAAELPGDPTPWRRWRVSLAKAVEQQMRMRAAGGAVPLAGLTAATAARLDAEIALAEPAKITVATPARPPIVTADARDRLAALRETAKLYRELIATGTWSSESLHTAVLAQRELVEATTDVYGPNASETIRAHEEWVAETVKLVNHLARRYEAGTLAKQVYTWVLAEKYRAQDELQMVRGRPQPAAK